MEQLKADVITVTFTVRGQLVDDIVMYIPSRQAREALREADRSRNIEEIIMKEQIPTEDKVGEHLSEYVIIQVLTKGQFTDHKGR